MASLSYTPINTIDSTVTELRAHFREGISKDIPFRKQQLKNLLRFFEENSDKLKAALREDLRKHELDSDLSEISPVVSDCRYMLDHLDKLAGTTQVKKRFLMNAADKTFIRKEAKGVVLIIGAWNYPVNLLFLPLVGALAAGNCIILKPSELAAHTAKTITDLLPNYLDERICRIVNGGKEQTTYLLEKKLDHIFYTGSGAIGRFVMAAAARHLTPVTLELGGKSPAIVAADTDVAVTANRIVWGKFFNCGQTCVAPDYVLVADQVKDKLVQEMKRAIREFYGENPQTSEAYGRIINDHQFRRLSALIDTTEDERIVCGGKTDPVERFISPTLIYPVNANTDPLMQDELFGPLLPIIPVESMNEAVNIINDRDSPLAMYIFTSKRETYEYVLDNTQSGGALVNDTMVHIQELSLPFGGVGASGMGSYHGSKSFDTFTHERSTMVRPLGLEQVLSLRYPSYNDDKATIMSLLVYGPPTSIVAKVKTAQKFIASAWRLYLCK